MTGSGVCTWAWHAQTRKRRERVAQRRPPFLATLTNFRDLKTGFGKSGALKKMSQIWAKFARPPDGDFNQLDDRVSALLMLNVRADQILDTDL